MSDTAEPRRSHRGGFRRSYEPRSPQVSHRSGDPRSPQDCILVAEHVTKTFRGMARPAVDDVTLRIAPGEFVGLVGGSGSGKSTLARVIMNLETPDAGAVVLDGREITRLRGRERRRVYADMQMVFQDQADSFDPRMRLGASAVEFGMSFGMSRAAARDRAAELFCAVGLSEEHLDCRPGEVSGGQCQRAAIARALMASPKVLVCDEVTSALDVLVQAAVVEVLRSLKGSVALLFISHDLALVDSLCDRTVVMREGRVVEEGPSHEVSLHPQHPYTQLLVSSVFPVDPLPSDEAPSLSGEPPLSASPFLSSGPLQSGTPASPSLHADPEAW